MTTKTTKTAVKKVARKKATTTRSNNTVTLTVAQARSIQTFLARNNKNYKFLDTKLNAVNA